MGELHGIWSRLRFARLELLRFCAEPRGERHRGPIAKVPTPGRRLCGIEYLPRHSFECSSVNLGALDSPGLLGSLLADGNVSLDEKSVDAARKEYKMASCPSSSPSSTQQRDHPIDTLS